MRHNIGLRTPLATLIVAIGLTVTGLGQIRQDEEAVWKAFVQWLEAQPPSSEPAVIFDAYREKLIRDGVSAAEASRCMGVIGRLVFERRESTGLLWNKVYAGDKPVFVQQPNALLASAIRDRKPGKALDVGMGQGRNAVFLAVQGWDVTGFDPSDVGVHLAQEQARKLGVSLHTVVTRDDDFEFGVEQWDLIVMTYVRRLTVADANRFWKALKPDGVFVYENSHFEQNELLKMFVKFRIVRFEDVDTTPDWHPNEKARIERLIAQRLPH